MVVQKYIHGATAVKIAASIETAIDQQKISGGESLPAVRALAVRLEVSPATVAAAYRILQERGITLSAGRRGTRIRPSAFASPLPAPTPGRGVADLAQGNPDRALLPDLSRALRRLRVRQRLYGDEQNDRQLVTMARRQFRADGLPAGSIAVVSGALDGIERIFREQLRPGDRVLVEDPSFTGILDLLASTGLQPVPVAVDDEGLVPAALEKAIRKPARAIVVTPRAQNPTGAAMSRRRARTLRAILRRGPDLLLIEDDHAGPIAGAPYVTLVEPSRARWAVVRSVSKFLGPDLRVAVMTGDAQTLSTLVRRQTTGIRWVSHVMQELVAALWSDRAVRRQLELAERTYRTRRQALIRELARRGIESHGASGLNVWIPVAGEAAVLQALLQRRWAVRAGERYRIESQPAIRVTIASLTPSEARRFAADLADVLSAAGRTMAA